MRTSILGIMLASALALTGPAFGKKAQTSDRQHTSATDRDNDQKATTKTHEKSKTDVTYGRIKDLQAGQKVVIDVANSMDKSYDMTDKDTKVTLSKTLKVGDPVRVSETDRNGHKYVRIVRDNNPNAKHGAKSATAEQRSSKSTDVRTDNPSDVHNNRDKKEYNKK